MKLNFTVEVSDYDDNVGNIEDAIVREAARQLVNEIFNNRYEHYGRTFKDRVEEKIKEMMLETFDINFKNEVKDKVVDELTKKYIRTKQYKEVKDQFNILTDTEIKTGLKEIISDLVSAELKNRFK